MWSLAKAAVALIKDKKELEIHNKFIPYETCLWDKQKYIGTEKCIQHLHKQLKNIAYEISILNDFQGHSLGYFGQMKNLNAVFGFSTIKNRLFEVVAIVWTNMLFINGNYTKNNNSLLTYQPI